MIDFLNKYNLGGKKLIGIGILFIILIIVIPLTLYQVQKQQNLEQRAEKLENVHLSVSTPPDQEIKKGKEFTASLILQNPNRKNVSALDTIITYDSDILELISAEPFGFSEIFRDISLPGKIHYVGTFDDRPPFSIQLGILHITFRPKADGEVTIAFSDSIFTVVGEPQAFTINPADNKPAVYVIAKPTPTTIASIPPIVSPTIVASTISPTISAQCQAPHILSCGFNVSSGTRPAWEFIEGVVSYRLEWCYNNANFSDEDFKNGLCGFITDPNTNVYISFPGGAKSTDYKVRVRAGSSDSCLTGEWSDIKSCSTIIPTLTPTPTSIPPPPSISNIGIDPSLGWVGTKFLVFSRVTSKASLQSVKATVRYQGSKIYEDTIQLYDDGTHGDAQAGDGYYMNVWDSNKKGLPKEIVIEAKDINENISTLNNVLDITEEVCKEAVPGHNDKNANRVNVVFTGANYGNIESFSKDVTEALDFGGTEGGLFSQEPFRSNKDKFNFWYSDRVGSSLHSCDIIHVNVFDLIKCRAEINASAKSCIVSNKTIIGLVNLDAHGAFGFGRTAYIPSLALRRFAPESNFIGKITIHEFGHSFGKLADEYIGSNVIEYFALDRILGEEKTIEALNIFKGTQAQCFSPKNPWYDLIGRGCGENNKLDCIKDYDSKNDTIVCIDGVSEAACWTEVGCFQGAGSPDNFRSTFANVMNASRRFDTFDLKLFSHAYGPVNEREICKRIKKVTGSAGGICTTDYGIR